MSDPWKPPGRRLLDDPALEDLWQELALDEGRAVFLKGDEGDALFVVVDGELDVVGQEGVLLERLGPGAIFGELALLTDERRSASVVCRSRATLRRLERGDFCSALGSRPSLGDACVALVSERLRRTNAYLDCTTAWARLMAEGHYDAAQRAIEAEGMRPDDQYVAEFARTFMRMLNAVREREAQLTSELRQLRIEVDCQRQARNVAAVTESEFFRELERNAARMRQRMHERGYADAGRRRPRDTES
jgi:CRP-like cAMP-binding protein